MKYLLIFLSTILISCQDSNSSCPKIQVRFSGPDGEIAKGIVSAIDNSHSSIYIQAYSFSSEPITNALIKAKQRGETVEVILDKGDAPSRLPLVNKMVNAGIVVSLDGAHQIAHNKIIILDNETVFTGSANLTNSGTQGKNAENSIEIGSKSIASTYLDNWKDHRKHSREFHNE